MKSKKELAALRNELLELDKKLSELNDEELKQVVGGTTFEFEQPGSSDSPFNYHIYNLDPDEQQFEQKN